MKAPQRKRPAVPKRRPSILFLLPHVTLFHATGKISVDLRWIRMYYFVMQSLSAPPAQPPDRQGQPHGAGMMQAKVFDDDRSLGDQRLGGLEVDHQFVFGRRLSRWF
jgi:hypothetical protein